MREIVKDYYIVVSQLEHQFQLVSEEHMFFLLIAISHVMALQGSLTLQHMWFLLQPSARLITLLGELAQKLLTVRASSA